MRMLLVPSSFSGSGHLGAFRGGAAPWSARRSWTARVVWALSSVVPTCPFEPLGLHRLHPDVLRSPEQDQADRACRFILPSGTQCNMGRRTGQMNIDEILPDRMFTVEILPYEHSGFGRVVGLGRAVAVSAVIGKNRSRHY